MSNVRWKDEKLSVLKKCPRYDSLFVPSSYKDGKRINSYYEVYRLTTGKKSLCKILYTCDNETTANAAVFCLQTQANKRFSIMKLVEHNRETNSMVAAQYFNQECFNRKEYELGTKETYFKFERVLPMEGFCCRCGNSLKQEKG